MGSVEPIVVVDDLQVAFSSQRRIETPAIRGVSLEVGRGEIVAVVGESGSGKTVLGLSMLGLLPVRPAPRIAGRVDVAGTDMVTAPERARRRVRREVLGAVFQDPMSSLNPSTKIEQQVLEKAPQQDPVALLERVGLDRAAERLRAYPHELSGGQRQRVMLAMAIARRPALVVADEPTTALDVTVQAQILGLIRQLRDDTGCSFLFITHDLGVASELADRVLVMYAGRLVEAGETEQIMTQPRHPYTISLLQSRLTLAADRSRPLPALAGAVPRPTDVIPGCLFAPRCPIRIAECDAESPPLMPIGASRVACIRHKTSAELMRVQLRTAEPATHEHVPASDVAAASVTLRDIRKVFGKRTLGRGVDIVALDDIDLDVQRGESVALVGESGSGKSTLLRVIAGLIAPTSGTVSIADHGDAQMVFQDAASSLTPWLNVQTLIRERVQGLGIASREVDQRVLESLHHVGLGPEFLSRKPRQLSGGQAQRVAIARAIAVPPKVLLADEPTSALDVSVAATVLNLLARLRRELGFSMVFVTHDLAVARVVADRIVVLLKGSIVEEGPTQAVISDPRSSYTRALIDAVPGKELAPPPPVPLLDSLRAGASGE